MNKYLVLGMALQAFGASILDSLGLIELCSGQQLIAGILFFVTYLIVSTIQDGY